ncbi:secretory phospholipase A2 receptor [Gastrophryne carolinensis]
MRARTSGIGVVKGQDAFLIQSEENQMCIAADSSRLFLRDCAAMDSDMLWKWGMKANLYNLGRRQCLGIRLSNGSAFPTMSECDSGAPWLCYSGLLVNAFQNKLIAVDGELAASKVLFHKWRRYPSTGENLCDKKFKVIYTHKGNGDGKPCFFPFKFNNTWHYECIQAARITGWDDGIPWCATKEIYDRNKRWGYCPSADGDDCGLFWEKNNVTHMCYQFNFKASLTWEEARASCQGQGGDLLSIANLDELEYVSKRIGQPKAFLWTGLNQLDNTAGWQWSDGTPFNIVNWGPNFYNDHLPEAFHCGISSGKAASSWVCGLDKAAYACKKSLTGRQDGNYDVFENWKYYPIVCEEGWIPQNRLCYQLHKQKLNWSQASAACLANGGQLISLTSMAHAELLLHLLHYEKVSETWIGMSSRSKHPAVFQWSDGSAVTFTSWQRHEPTVTQEDSDLCVSAQASFPLKLLFEQAFINSMIANRIIPGNYYFWIALEDRNGSGEYVWTVNDLRHPELTFTNWNTQQPSQNKGCVVVSRPALGRWEVKDCKKFSAMSLCKRPITGVITVEKQTKDIDKNQPCAPAWDSESHLEHCYRVFHEEKILTKRTWQEAESMCQDFGSHLVSFSILEEERFVKELLSGMFKGHVDRQFWVGLNNRNPSSEGSWEWSDGTPVVSAYWQDVYVGGGSRNCAAFRANNTFVPLNCDAKLEWVCKIPRGVKPKTPDWHIADAMDVPFVFFQGHNYLFSNEMMNFHGYEFSCLWMGGYITSILSEAEQDLIYKRIKKCYLVHSSEEEGMIDWHSADNYCKKHGGSLARISNEIEQAFIVTHLYKQKNSFWIGISRDEYDLWENGTLRSYTNWIPITANHSLLNIQNRQCAAMSADHQMFPIGKWHLEICDDKVGYGFICEKQQAISSHAGNATLPVEEQIPYGNKLYRIISGILTWYDAVSVCEEYGANLVTITDEYHQAFITIIAHQMGYPHWIGFYMNNAEREFEWVDGSLPLFSAWADESPPLQEDSCVYIETTGQWRTLNCNVQLRGAICLINTEMRTDENITECPEDWIAFSDFCYSSATISNNADYRTAEDICQQQDSRILTSLSEDEERFLKQFLATFTTQQPHGIWLDRISFSSNGSQTWSDGTPLQFSNWNSEVLFSLTDALREDWCVTRLMTDGTWLPTQCTARRGFICKKHTKTSHVVVPVAVLVTVILSALLLFAWYLRKKNRRLTSPDFQNLSCTQPGTEGGDTEEYNAELPDFIWIGLNRLESAGGWQWSDNRPLNFVNWDNDTVLSVLDDSSCGRLNVNTGQWEVFPCEASLPYVCRFHKEEIILFLFNNAKVQSYCKMYTEDYWHYSETTCEGNWTAYNGFCYSLQQPNSWNDANLSCQKENASLISLHSLADIELVVTKFHSESEKIWTGFQSESFPNLYKWSDGTEARFTYWDRNEPRPVSNGNPSCVSFSNMDWRRHGDSCYLINTTEVTFAERCNLTITNKFEQEFLNSLIREQINRDRKYFWTSLQDPYQTGDYYWQTSHGEKNVSYSNWNLHQPAFPGGCVAMAASESVGQWEVKDCKSFKAQSICKKWIGSAEEKEEAPKVTSDKCPDGWTAGQDLYCYKLFNRERIQRQRTWQEAEGICEEFGGSLVSFSHIQEMKNFHSLLNQWISDKRSIWVGLNKRNLGSWEWSDGRAVSKKHYAHVILLTSLQYNEISSTILDEFQEDDYFLRDCAAVEINLPKQRIPWTWYVDIKLVHEPEYSLHPYHCDAQLEWVCQVPKGWKDKVHAPLIIGGAEYWFVSDVKLSHREAALYCASNSSELAVIDSFNAMIDIQEHLFNQNLTMTKWWVKSTDFRSHHQ